MMYKKIEGIVVSEVPFEDSSKIINVFTEDGIIGIVAKGAKRIKSPFFSVTSKFSYGIFNIIYKENGLSKLVEADVLKDYRNIKKDIKKISFATYITELTLQVYRHENNENIFNLFISSLDKINEGYDEMIITDILKLKLLDYLGIRPIIDRCVECGRRDNIVTISSYRGGFVCKDCYRNEKIVSTKTISIIRMFYLAPIDKISRLDISENIKNEIDEFINDYYDRYSGIYLKSKVLLDSIK
ncbi:MAG: DNA repair protein RecO [Bacilli bacterium]